MERKRCRSSGGQPESHKAASKPVGMYFFKVLIGDFHSKLYIPPAFARLIEDDDSKDATLNTSVGCFQDIEVLKDSYSTFFQSGWCEFVEHHYLETGEFLVFRYDGGMQFDVKIFGRSGCENFCFKPVLVEDKNASPSNVCMCNPEVSRNECEDEVADDNCQRLRENCSSS
ncbi:B3 domain-containing protein [Nymphaea thermarum]|nr:B3 domain-containing protein [Nymphaea thermarum]